LGDLSGHLLLAHLAGGQIGQRAARSFGYLLCGRLDLAGDPEHQLLEILEQKSGLLNIPFHHRGMIQGAKSAREAKPVKTTQDPDNVSLMFLDKGVWDAFGIGGKFSLHDQLLPKSSPVKTHGAPKPLWLTASPCAPAQGRCRAGIFAFFCG
jgi:hypothetical protein